MLYPISFVLEALLQWWLSGRKSRVWGWILPALHIVLSIVIIVSFAAFSFVSDVAVTSVAVTSAISNTAVSGTLVLGSNSGEVLAAVSTPVEDDGMTDGPTSVLITEEIEATPDESRSVGIIGGADGPTAIFVSDSPDWLMFALAFLLLNIPTAVLLVIYFIRRRRIKRNTINKTIIQDL